MKFKPGDKVWVDAICGSYFGDLPIGTYPGVIAGPCFIGHEWWSIEIGGKIWFAHQNHIRPRDDPPPAQREATGQWDSCVWKPAREEVLI